MVISIVAIVGCAITIVLFLVIVIGIVIFVVIQSEQRDTVSTAREGWIHRRSEKDEQDW